MGKMLKMITISESRKIFLEEFSEGVFIHKNKIKYRNAGIGYDNRILIEASVHIAKGAVHILSESGDSIVLFPHP